MQRPYIMVLIHSLLFISFPFAMPSAGSASAQDDASRPKTGQSHPSQEARLILPYYVTIQGPRRAKWPNGAGEATKGFSQRREA